MELFETTSNPSFDGGCLGHDLNNAIWLCGDHLNDPNEPRFSLNGMSETIADGIEALESRGYVSDVQRTRRRGARNAPEAFNISGDLTQKGIDYLREVIYRAGQQ